MLAQAPIGVALAAIFLHEAIGPIQVLGGAAILAASILIQRGPTPDAAVVAAPAS